jgi:putative membrane protein
VGLAIAAVGCPPLTRYARRVGRGPVPSWGHLVAWEGAVAAIAAATCAPMDALSDSRLSAHMVQHELLAFVAAPLSVIGAAPLGVVVLPWLGGTLARWGHALTRPRTAWLIAAVVLWAWHWPPAYDLALARPWVHDLEHLTFLLVYALFWSPFVPFGHAAAALRSGGARAWYLITGGGQSAVLGALIAFAPSPVYSHYVTDAGAQAALRDQELAGAIMLLSGAVVFALAAAVAIRGE